MAGDKKMTEIFHQYCKYDTKAKIFHVIGDASEVVCQPCVSNYTKF
jgi:hypothetical protein